MLQTTPKTARAASRSTQAKQAVISEDRHVLIASVRETERVIDLHGLERERNIDLEKDSAAID